MIFNINKEVTDQIINRRKNNYGDLLYVNLKLVPFTQSGSNVTYYNDKTITNKQIDYDVILQDLNIKLLDDTGYINTANLRFKTLSNKGYNKIYNNYMRILQQFAIAIWWNDNPQPEFNDNSIPKSTIGCYICYVKVSSFQISKQFKDVYSITINTIATGNTILSNNTNEFVKSDVLKSLYINNKNTCTLSELFSHCGVKPNQWTGTGNDFDYGDK